MDRENLNIVTFAEEIGVAQATISHILGGRNKYPSTEVILRLHQRYPDINLNWLLTGEGNIADDKSEVQKENLDYPLFDDNINFSDDPALHWKNSKEMVAEEQNEKVNSFDQQYSISMIKPQRKITEIRIFFNDNTYETFRPEK